MLAAKAKRPFFASAVPQVEEKQEARMKPQRLTISGGDIAYVIGRLYLSSNWQISLQDIVDLSLICQSPVCCSPCPV